MTAAILAGNTRAQQPQRPQAEAPEWWPPRNEADLSQRLHALHSALSIAFRPKEAIFPDEYRPLMGWLIEFTAPQKDWEKLKDSPEGTPVTFFRFEKDETPPQSEDSAPQYKPHGRYNANVEKVEFTNDGHPLIPADAMAMALLASTNPAMRGTPVKLTGDPDERAFLAMACQTLGLKIDPETMPTITEDQNQRWQDYFTAATSSGAEPHEPDQHQAPDPDDFEDFDLPPDANGKPDDGGADDGGEIVSSEKTFDNDKGRELLRGLYGQGPTAILRQEMKKAAQRPTSKEPLLLPYFERTDRAPHP